MPANSLPELQKLCAAELRRGDAKVPRRTGFHRSRAWEQQLFRKKREWRCQRTAGRPREGTANASGAGIGPVETKKNFYEKFNWRQLRKLYTCTKEEPKKAKAFRKRNDRRWCRHRRYHSCSLDNDDDVWETKRPQNKAEIEFKAKLFAGKVWNRWKITKLVTNKAARRRWIGRSRLRTCEIDFQSNQRTAQSIKR